MPSNELDGDRVMEGVIRTLRIRHLHLAQKSASVVSKKGQPTTVRMNTLGQQYLVFLDQRSGFVHNANASG